MKKNIRKYSLHENDFYEDENGKIVRFGKGSYYQISSEVYKWFKSQRRRKRAVKGTHL